MRVKEVSITQFFVRRWSLGMRQHKMAEIRASNIPHVNTVYMLQNTLAWSSSLYSEGNDCYDIAKHLKSLKQSNKSTLTWGNMNSLEREFR